MNELIIVVETRSSNRSDWMYIKSALDYYYKPRFYEITLGGYLASTWQVLGNYLASSCYSLVKLKKQLANYLIHLTS